MLRAHEHKQPSSWKMRPHVLCLSLTCPLIGTQRPHYAQVTTPAAGSTEVHVVKSRQALIPQLLFGVDVFLKCSHLPRFLVSSVSCLVFFVGPWRLLAPQPVVSQGPAPAPLPLYMPDSRMTGRESCGFNQLAGVGPWCDQFGPLQLLLVKLQSPTCSSHLPSSELKPKNNPVSPFGLIAEALWWSFTHWRAFIFLTSMFSPMFSPWLGLLRSLTSRRMGL